MPLQAPTITPYQNQGQGLQALQQQQAQKQAQTGQTISSIAQIGGMLASLIPVVGPILGPLLAAGGTAAGGAIAQDRGATDAHMQQATQPVQAPQIGAAPGMTNRNNTNDLSTFLSGLGQQRMG